MSLNDLEEYIANADTAALEALLARNPELAGEKTSLNVSPLMLSCYYNKPDVTRLLLKYTHGLSLFEAAAADRFDDVAYQIATHPERIDFYADDGFTALGLACYFGRYDIARYLVLKGADVNRPSDNGFNVYPLHSAIAGNFTSTATMLIENGADVNVKQQKGSTPLHFAAQNGNLELIILLLEKGARVDIRMEGGKLPSDLAREKGFDEIAEILEN
ncbi:ankyrin repeat domain-containing protein [Mucilaginibacter lutimaris]|uniref:Ankyrin repeat domain-containing protein n=1 Tax=Mucilaginibacter lutimaris TaxID=931629 RepID=A0ABW2ZLI7_9SPHI